MRKEGHPGKEGRQRGGSTVASHGDGASHGDSDLRTGLGTIKQGWRSSHVTGDLHPRLVTVPWGW